MDWRRNVLILPGVAISDVSTAPTVGQNRGPAVISIAIIEDNRLVREGIAALLGQLPDLKVVAGGHSDDTVLLKGVNPQVILLDLGLQNGDSLRVAQQVKADYPASRIIVMDLLPVHEDIMEFVNAGVPFELAEDIAILPLLGAVPEIIMLSQTQRVSAWDAARIYFAAGATVGLDRLRALAARIPTADHWDRLALRRILDDLYAAQRTISAEVLSAGGSEGAAAVEIWRKRRRDDVERTLNFLNELERSGDASLSKLALANSQIQKLAAGPVTQTH